MKISDSACVTLISETLDARSPQRRRAALILLDMTKADAPAASEEAQVAAIRRNAGPAVAAEVRLLLARIGVTLSEDPGAVAKEA